MSTIVFTDLDGTLLRDDKTISDRDIGTLRELGRRGVIRVAATGRNYLSVGRVLPDDFPIDFLIFSTGAGVRRWEDKELLLKINLNRDEMSHIFDLFTRFNISFMVHQGVPDNHRLMWYEKEDVTRDFRERLGFYTDFAEKGNGEKPDWEYASQFLTIFPPDQPEHYSRLERLLHEYTVIRTTSPLDNKSLWVEIFPASVSKGQGAEWLINHLGIPRRETLAVGNDYNDVDLLRWAHKSYVVANSPEDMRSEFVTVSSNERQGFTEAVIHSGVLN